MDCDGNSTKRKLNNFTLKQKIDILNNIKCGNKSRYAICQEYNIGESTLRKWIHDEDKLREFWSKNNTCSSHKKIRTEDNPHLGEALFIWYNENRILGIPITGPVLKAKARIVNRLLDGKKKFSASNGWLSKWKKRYNIRELSISGEKKPSDANVVEQYITELSEIINRKSLSRCQIFNCDETILNYKMLPDRIIAEKNEEQQRLEKINNEHVTVMACSNSDGSLKLPLAVIGRSEKPSSIKNIQSSNLPVFYASQQKARLNRKIFNEWFEKEFVTRVAGFLTERNLPMTAILIVDNASSHLAIKASFGDIKTHFLPVSAAATSLLQPMEQGIFQTLRIHFKHALVTSVLNAREDGIDVIRYLRSVNLREVIHWVNDAWEEIRPSSISRCWEKLLPVIRENQNVRNASSQTITSSEILCALHRIDEFKNLTENQVDEWIAYENTEATSSTIMTDDEIIQMVLCQRNEDETNDEEINCEDENEVTGTDAINAINRVIHYFKKSNCMTGLEMCNLYRLKGRALTIKMKS
ncbi:jerky protein homolog-like [Neodiprion fabricii]|uniref:jerky protein homolog-like n=1 Tax=Neodiprion fabricii TaxID=2872261 RepID=UPI001ED8CD05|nr:jerky protein homolog-like [Neodiprion fabricii]